MVLSDTIFARILEEPFRPFRIKTASGRVFDIRHVDTVAVGVKTVSVITDDEADLTATGGVHRIPLAEIETVESLKQPRSKRRKTS